MFPRRRLDSDCTVDQERNRSQLVMGESNAYTSRHHPTEWMGEKSGVSASFNRFQKEDGAHTAHPLVFAAHVWEEVKYKLHFRCRPGNKGALSGTKASSSRYPFASHGKVFCLPKRFHKTSLVGL